jgi:signal transduction histidine kinase
VFADDDFAAVDAIASLEDDAFGIADETNARLRQDLAPADALAGAVNGTARFVQLRGFTEEPERAWAWVFEPVFDLPVGWSTPGSDAEGAALARERFSERLEPTVIAIPDAATILALPVIARVDDEEAAGAMIAVPLSGGAPPDDPCVIGAATSAGIVAMQLENSVRANAARRALEFARAAALVQQRLVEPMDRTSALRIATDLLAVCSSLECGCACEIEDGERREVAGFGERRCDDAAQQSGVDADEVERAREAARATLEITIDDVLEAEITVQSRYPFDPVERDTLNSIAAAVAGTTIRSRATATIENLRRSATRRLVEAQERERSMVAADIHDGVLQQLGATAIRLELAQSRVEQHDFDAASEIIADGAKEIRACARELRALLMELRPQVLDDNGLNAALSELGRHVEDVEVEVRSDVPDDLGTEFSITIFRIVQEALTNIQKHAEASHASVDVRLEDDTISIDIVDDGVGFEGSLTGPSAEGSHLGLLGMRERARMFGGNFSISGASGGGSALHATLPLDGAAGDED